METLKRMVLVFGIVVCSFFLISSVHFVPTPKSGIVTTSGEKLQFIVDAENYLHQPLGEASLKQIRDRDEFSYFMHAKVNGRTIHVITLSDYSIQLGPFWFEQERKVSI